MARTLINFLLDTSGSMEVVREATVAGFNAFLRTQRAVEGDVDLTLTTFDTEVKEVCRAIPLREVPDLRNADFRPEGCTALYDAVAHSLRLADSQVASAPNPPEQVLFVVLTDGDDNASREITRAGAFELIRARAERYEFVFLGAGEDAHADGAAIGVRPTALRRWEHDAAGVEEVLAALGDRVATYRSQGSARMAEPWFPDEREGV